MGEERQTVSLCMIVKNEERHLEGCLASVADLVQEIVVVDTGSTDGTRDVASRMGARVVDFPWCDDFAAARNESLRHASCEWILWLDADEHLDDANRERLRNLLANLGDENAAYTMRQSSALEAALEATACVDQVRLFRNEGPGARGQGRERDGGDASRPSPLISHASIWQYRVHEQILPSLRKQGVELRLTDIVITHDGFADPAVQGAKVERNLRLLQMDFQEHAEDPFILYNLGAVYLTQGKLSEALALLKRSVERSHPQDSLVPKLHALVTRCLHQMGQKDEALRACRAGRVEHPEDAELLFWEGVLCRETGDLARAEGSLLQVLHAPARPRFTGVDAGLQGYRARHLLAELYRDQGRTDDAEAQWSAALAERPNFTLAWRNLAELFLAQGRWVKFDEATAKLENPADPVEAQVMRARGELARKEFAGARERLRDTIGLAPKALWPRVILSHVLLQEGKDWPAAEQALLDIQGIDPGNAEAAHNLRVLRAQDVNVGRIANPSRQAPSYEGRRTGSPSYENGRIANPSYEKGTISLCMIVKNEEANLAACLKSVKDLVDEIIVVDTGSTDGTRALAERLGARVFDFPWVDDFAAARNESLDHATGDWIFWMDADDRLDADNRSKLRSLFAGLGDDNAAYVMKCLCLPDPTAKNTTVVDHVRLFRNHPELRWRYRVHEQILPAIRQLRTEVRWSDVVIEHTGYQDPAVRSRKLERDLRLLRLDHVQHLDDPFILFNLGSIAHEQGQPAEALNLLVRSLQLSHPQDSIVRKLYVLTTQCHNQLGQKAEALAACRAGRALYPDDTELSFQEGVVLRKLGDLIGARKCWERVLATAPGVHFASVNTGIHGYLTRHNLAAVCHDLGDDGASETYWRAVLAERPDYNPAWTGLGEIYLREGRWPDLEDAAGHLESGPDALLRGRGLLARKEFAAAQALFADTADHFPNAIEPRQLLSHAYLQEGRDWQGAEKALRTVLKLAPDHREARHNLDVLMANGKSRQS